MEKCLPGLSSQLWLFKATSITLLPLLGYINRSTLASLLLAFVSYLLDLFFSLGFFFLFFFFYSLVKMALICA